MSIKSKHPFLLSLFLSLTVFFAFSIPRISDQFATSAQSLPTTEVGPASAKVELAFFYSDTCSHCKQILEMVIKPLQAQYPDRLQLHLYELANPVNYEALMKLESVHKVEASARGLPTVFIGERVLIGETQNNSELKGLIEAGLKAGTLPLPSVEGVDWNALQATALETAASNPLVCNPSNPNACTVNKPIYAAFFYQTGCKECGRATTDLNYLKTKYPQLIVEEFNIYDDAALANWMAARAGIDANFKVPALFIGDNAWIGPEELTPQNVEPALQSCVSCGAEAFWKNYNATEGNNALLDKFSQWGYLAIVLAGLIDGLNPCAFATIIFFVSYLTLSGKKGKEVLITGASFTLGVFLAYMLVGLGFYKVLDLVKNTLTLVSKIVYGLTAAICLVLAVLSIRDYFKTRHGDLDDMALKLPEPLRKRINATIREGRNASSYYLGAFVTGLLISLLELACTGQIYLPTIIFMSTQASMRVKAIGSLILYNTMFIVPLIVVFILAYYGTTSKQFTGFLQKHAGLVKLGMAIVFVLLGGWLLYSVLA